MERLLLRFVAVWCCVAVIGGGVSAAGAMSSARHPDEALIPVPTYAASNHHVIGGGHDAHSYWLVFQDYSTAETYSITVAVKGRIFNGAPWVLPPLPRPAATAHKQRQRIVISGVIDDRERRQVSLGFASATHRAFLALAEHRYVSVVDQRTFVGGRSGLPILAFLSGSLSTTVWYGIRIAGLEVRSPLGFEGPQTCTEVPAGAVIGWFPTGRPRTVSVYVDGRLLAEGRPGHDPREPSQRGVALVVPAATQNVDIAEDGRLIRHINVPQCIYD